MSDSRDWRSKEGSWRDREEKFGVNSGSFCHKRHSELERLKEISVDGSGKLEELFLSWALENSQILKGATPKDLQDFLTYLSNINFKLKSAGKIEKPEHVANTIQSCLNNWAQEMRSLINNKANISYTNLANSFVFLGRIKQLPSAPKDFFTQLCKCINDKGVSLKKLGTGGQSLTSSDVQKLVTGASLIADFSYEVLYDKEFKALFFHSLDTASKIIGSNQQQGSTSIKLQLLDNELKSLRNATDRFFSRSKFMWHDGCLEAINVLNNSLKSKGHPAEPGIKFFVDTKNIPKDIHRGGR